MTNRSNAYGNSMIALLIRTLASKPEWLLANPLADRFPDGDFGRLLREQFWMSARGCFRDAIGSDATTGEANVWPFWTGSLDSPVMLGIALATLQRDGYCDPYPLRYTPHPTPKSEVWLVRHFLPDYQGSSVLTSLGDHLQLSQVDRASCRRLGPLRRLDERDGAFWRSSATRAVAGAAVAA